MTDKSSKYSKNYKLSITNPKIFEALKLVISILIGLALTFVILCFVSKDPFNAFITILTGPLKKTRYTTSMQPVCSQCVCVIRGSGAQRRMCSTTLS